MEIPVPNLQDRTLKCADCGVSFVFTVREQEFYQERNFSEPRRCPSCRAARKTGRQGEQSSRGFGSPSGERRFQGDRPARPMFDIVCDGCGKPAQVPFKPREDRPVYCKDCYEAHRND